MSHPAGECPVCKKAFVDGDDIVTCPSCGAPYHRDCYQKEGRCLFTAKHGSGFEYQAPQSAPPPAAAPSAESARATYQNTTASRQGNSGGVLCKNCQTVNDSGNIFCENCGASLHAAAPPNRGSGPFSGAPLFQGGAAYGSTPYGADASGTLDGVPVRDWVAYIGPNAPAYLQRMDTMEAYNRPFSFFFSAFFISPIFFAYRKMWGWAALALLGTILFAVPQYLIIAANAGVNFFPALSATMLGNIDMVCTYLSLAMQLAFGIFAIQLYKKQAKKQMQQLREKTQTDSEYYAALSQTGGTSNLAAVLVVVLLGALVMGYVYLCISIGGMDFVNAVMSMYS